MTFTIYPGPVQGALDEAYRRIETRGFAGALWSRRLDVWSADPAVQQKIANRLGWLESLAYVTPYLPRVRAVAESVKASGITDIVLLGMGGSSLAPEVLRSVVGVAPGFPRFQVLDSVDPDAVRAAMAHAATSLFVLASKSGSTIEPNVMAAEAERRLRDAGIADPWSRFIAITDEGTALHARATESAFRETFVNPADIGGRYSALSFFGLVPAALMGIDIDGLVASGRAMADACREPDPRRNPGLALGALMGAGASTGRDKLTLALPAQFQRFGLWVEQLVAESTGKQGQGVVPVTADVGDTPTGPDRLIVRWGSDLGSDQGSDRGSDQGSDRGSDQGSDRGSDQGSDRVSAQGVRPIGLTPSIVLETAGLGGEFFRWEFATATAGFLLGINPFDEPNVQQAKDATRALLDTYVAQRRLPVPEPDAAIEGVRVTLSEAARQRTEDPRRFLSLLQPPDYFAVLVFLPADDDRFASTLESIRRDVAASTGCAATLGYGPRYLHSTGQLHKGGPNSGVFLIVSADASPDLEIPGEPYSFGILEQAQALGDFESLNRLGRRAMHVHMPARDAALLRQILSNFFKDGNLKF